jgi:hypothetical protein
VVSFPSCPGPTTVPVDVPVNICQADAGVSNSSARWEVDEQGPGFSHMFQDMNITRHAFRESIGTDTVKLHTEVSPSVAGQGIGFIINNSYGRGTNGILRGSLSPGDL